MKRYRTNFVNRDKEATKQREKRKKVEFTEKEAAKKVVVMREKRENVEFKEKEAAMKREKRENVEFKEKEAAKKVVVMRSKRKNVEFKEKEKSRRKVIRSSASKSKSKSMEARIKEFHTTISVGPTYSCRICNLLCYKKKHFKHNKLQNTDK